MIRAIKCLTTAYLLVGAYPLSANQSRAQPVALVIPVNATDHHRIEAQGQKSIAPTNAAAVNVPVNGDLKLAGNVDQTKGKEDSSKWTDPVTLLTAVLAVANIALWIVTWKMAREARGAGITARTSATTALASVEAYKASERAWIGHVDIPHHLYNGLLLDEAGVERVGVAYQFFVRWRNGGRTPAIHTKVFMTGAWRNEGDDEVPRFTTDGELLNREMVLIPDSITACQPYTVPEADVMRLMRNERKLYLYSRVDYDLVFEKPADERPYTEICFEVMYRGDFQGQRVFNYLPVGSQNMAT